MIIQIQFLFNWGVMKRSKLVADIQFKLDYMFDGTDEMGDTILTFIEQYMEPKLRPLTNTEIDNHELVKAVHDSRKDEVRQYVAELLYERKRTWEPEDG